MSNHGGSRPGSGRKASGRVGITLRLSVETVERLVNATRLTRGNTHSSSTVISPSSVLTSKARTSRIPVQAADSPPARAQPGEMRMSDTIHPFEAAGLGIAPFSYVGMTGKAWIFEMHSGSLFTKNLWRHHEGND